MANWKVGNGCQDYIKTLNKLLDNTDEVIGRAVFEGAKIVTDQISSNIGTIPVGEGSWGTTGTISHITKTQAKGLKEGLGIAPMRNDNGYLNVKVGMDGYNHTVTKKYPKGQPNAMIARAVESGTSFRAKTPFIYPAVQSTRGTAEKAMAEELDKQIQKITQ